MSILTWGESVYDTTPKHFETNWGEIKELLLDASGVPRSPFEKDSGTPWISPAIFEGRRSDHMVKGFSDWIALDLDSAGWNLDRIAETLADIAEWLAYTTTRSTALHPRWRLVVRLSRGLSHPEYNAVWMWLDQLLDGALDQKTRNPSRIYYVPAMWEGAFNQFHHSGPGGALQIESVLEQIKPFMNQPTMTPTPHEPIGSGARPDVQIISEKMLSRVIGQPEGGRMYRLLTAAAVLARRNGWALPVDELTAAAQAANSVISPHKKRPGLRREAERAIHWAILNVTPLSPVERAREHLRWQARQRLWQHNRR